MSDEVTAEDLIELHALETACGVDSLIEFVPRVSKRWVPPWHLRKVAELFVRAEYGSVQACVSVPPRHGKTELILHAISWWLSRHPAAEIIYASYSATRATKKCRRALDIAKLAGIPLRSDAQRADEWQTEAGGGLMSSGVEGGITGEGADVLIVDDPFRNRRDAESPTIRQAVWEWFKSTVLTRISPGGSVIVVHTRWHEDDLIGRLMKRRADSYEFVNLPAVNDNDEALWPWRYDEAALAAKRIGVGEFDWWALFMGSPSPKGGGLFKAWWWRFYETGAGGARPDDCDLEEPAVELPKSFDWELISVDAAFKKKLTGSEVGMLVIGGHGANRYVLDNWTRHMGIVETMENITCLRKRYPKALRVLVEDKANGSAVIEMLHKKISGLIAVNPQGGKESRASAMQPSVQSGNWYLPEGGIWVPGFVTQFSLFPSGANDDMVDAASQAEIFMNEGIDLIRARMLCEW